MKRKISYLGLLSLSFLAIASQASTKDELVDSLKVYDIEEVYVIEQPKESFRLRQQPISSSSFDSSSLGALHFNDIRDLSAFVPSFVMPQYGSRYTSAMYVRGIGSRINSPAVGIYLDGIPLQNKSVFNFQASDIERVDVLRGPQGTLYGMNTEGGLVRLYTKNPKYYQGTNVKISFGNKFYRKAEVGHYARLNDQMAFSLSAFYSGSNGFFHNQTTGEKADKYNEFGGKGRFLWDLNDRLEVSLTADYQYVRQNAFPYGQVVSKEEIAAVGITSPYYGLTAGTQQPTQNRQSNYRRNMLNTGLGIRYVGEQYVFHSMTSWQFMKDYMLMDMDYIASDFMHLEQRQHQNAITQEFSVKSKNDQAWQWAFGAFGAYQWLKTIAPVYFDTDMNKFLSRNITSYAYNGMLTAMANRMAQAMIAKGMPEAKAMEQAKIAAAAAIAKAGGVSIGMELNPISGLFRTPTMNLGVFHESNVRLTKDITATFGLRYDYSKVRIDYATEAQLNMTQNVMGVQLNPVITSKLADKRTNDFEQLLPKVGLTYRLKNGSNIYLSWAKGYRGGGYNFQMFSDILQAELSQAANTARANTDITHDAAFYDKIAETIEYKPEVSWNYEVGTHLNLCGGQLQLDLAAFYMQIRNQQLSVMAGNYGLGRMMTNAGKSHSLGLEATLRGIALHDRLSYNIAYGFTKAEFDEYTGVTPSGEVSYANKNVPFVPQHTLSAHAGYRIDVDPAALLDANHLFRLRYVTLGAMFAAQGKTYWDEQNSISQNFYATVGAFVNANFGRLQINLWAKNITDARYNTFAVQSGATGEKYTFAQLGNPFQLGIDFTYQF